MPASVRNLAPHSVDHIVEVAFGENIQLDLELLAPGGSIAAYATHEATPRLPFWELLFKNASLHLIGSDDVAADVKQHAANALNAVMESGWAVHVFRSASRFDEVALAHEHVEQGAAGGQVILVL